MRRPAAAVLADHIASNPANVLRGKSLSRRRLLRALRGRLQLLWGPQALSRRITNVFTSPSSAVAQNYRLTDGKLYSSDGGRAAEAAGRTQRRARGRRPSRQRAASSWSRNYDQVSTEEIVKRSGVSRGALYHHVLTELDLFRAVFEASEARVIGRIPPAQPAQPVRGAPRGATPMRQAETDERATSPRPDPEPWPCSAGEPVGAVRRASCA